MSDSLGTVSTGQIECTRWVLSPESRVVPGPDLWDVPSPDSSSALERREEVSPGCSLRSGRRRGMRSLVVRAQVSILADDAKEDRRDPRQT